MVFELIAVGVPDIVPVVALILNPAGNAGFMLNDAAWLPASKVGITLVKALSLKKLVLANT